MKAEVKKLYLDKYVSVRDYFIKRSKERGESLKVEYNGKIMTIKYKDLGKGIPNGRRIESRFNRQSYDLIDFVWVPD